MSVKKRRKKSLEYFACKLQDNIKKRKNKEICTAVKLYYIKTPYKGQGNRTKELQHKHYNSSISLIKINTRRNNYSILTKKQHQP